MIIAKLILLVGTLVSLSSVSAASQHLLASGEEGELNPQPLPPIVEEEMFLEQFG